MQRKQRRELQAVARKLRIREERQLRRLDALRTHQRWRGAFEHRADYEAVVAQARRQLGAYEALLQLLDGA